MEKTLLPQITIRGQEFSRLVVGANTINGGSHLSRFTNNQMKRYFTKEQIFSHLRDCEQAGINTWQSSYGNLDLYQEYKDQGGKLQYISLGGETDNEPGNLKKAYASGVSGIAHHGEITDQLFKSGQFNKVKEFCKSVRDTGMLVGVSSHMPDAVELIINENWDVDFFMCCIYERHRTREELKKMMGYVPIPVSEVYLESDPARMFRVMNKTEKPCFAFKILAAGRLCDNQETVEQAFSSTFTQIKNQDAVIVGMYPEYEDQVALNAGYVKKYG